MEIKNLWKTLFMHSTLSMWHFSCQIAFQATCKRVINFSEKKLYGFNVEVTPRTNWLAPEFNKHYSGLVSDLTIFNERLFLHKIRLKRDVDTATWQVLTSIHWSSITRPEVRSLLGQPSYGKPQPGYWLLRSRVRIPRGHRLVSIVDVPYSDPFLEASSRGIFPSTFFA